MKNTVALVVLLLSVPTGWAQQNKATDITERKYQGKLVSQWLEDLESSDQQKAAEAARTLGYLGQHSDPECKPLIKPLAAVLGRRGNDLVRLEAVKSLGKMAPLAQKAIPALTAALSDPHPQIRVWSHATLWQITRDDKHVAALIAALSDKNDMSIIGRSTPAQALGEIGPPARAAVPHLINALAEGDLFLATAAAEALGNMGTSARPAIPALAKTLENKQALVRANALIALGNLGPDSEDAVPAMVRALDNPEDRFQTLQSLRQIGPKARAAIPALVKLLKNSEPRLRYQAAAALEAMGPFARGAVPELAAALDDPVSDVRRAAADALGEIGPPAKAAVEALRKHVKETGGILQIKTSLALWRIAPEKAAVEGALESLTNPDKEVRQEAVRALRETADPSALPALLEALKDREPEVRSGACSALGALGPAAKPAVPALAKMLTDPQSYVRISATLALEEIGPDARAAVPDLLAASAGKDDRLRFWSIQALAATGERTPEAVAALERAGHDPLADVRVASHHALWTTTRDSRYLAALIEDCQKKPRADGSVDYSFTLALAALRKIGPAAKSALPRVKELLSDKDPFVRIEANRALWHISKDAETIPALIEILKSQRGESRFIQAHQMANHRQLAIEALGDIGPAARAAIPLLVESLEDNMPWARKAAEKALPRIDPNHSRQ